VTLRVNQMFAAAERARLSRYLPGVAVLLITVFAWSLAQAHGNPGGMIENSGIRPIAEQGTTENEAALFSQPVGTAQSFRPQTRPEQVDRFTPRARFTN
jgi:hypothetical protein